VTQLPAPPALTPEVIGQMQKGQKSATLELEFGGKKVPIHYEDVSPVSGAGQLSVIFLHSGVFSSKVWLDTQTLYHLANWGCRAVAIDLPGKGQSPVALEECHWDDFLCDVISSLNLDPVVLVSPSSGGKYAIPYLFKKDGPAAGFVPIAPHKTAEFKDKYPANQMPTLIVYGADDPKGPETMKDLIGLPNHQVACIEGAGHPCYKDKTEDFHKVLYSWIKHLIK